MEMEIPVINRIGDFEAGITSLQNPSFVSQIFSISSVVGKFQFHQPSSFLKWGALILAFVASFSTIIRRIKFLIFRLHSYFFPAPSSPNTIQYDYSDDSETDSSCSSISSEDEDDEDEKEEEDDDEPTVSFSSQNWWSIDEDFSVKGSGNQWQNRSLRKRRNRSIGDLFSSFSELTHGKNVVKLWDNLGLGLRFNESRNHVSVFDTNYEQNLFSIFGEKSQIPAVSVSSWSPAVIVSAETNVSGHLLKVWDTRVGSRLPGIMAEWRPKLGKIVGIGGGLEKVYARNDVTGRLAVGDMRKVLSPLATTESNPDTWWDADGSIDGENESVDEVSGGDSVFRRG